MVDLPLSQLDSPVSLLAVTGLALETFDAVMTVDDDDFSSPILLANALAEPVHTWLMGDVDRHFPCSGSVTLSLVDDKLQHGVMLCVLGKEATVSSGTTVVKGPSSLLLHGENYGSLTAVFGNHTWVDNPSLCSMGLCTLATAPLMHASRVY